MAPTLASSTSNHRRPTGDESGRPSRQRRAREQRRRAIGRDQRALGRYTDRQGRAREVLTRPGAVGSVLVVDCDRATHSDMRLVAHLAADEPTENAALICATYLVDVAGDRGRCRLLTAEDTRGAPSVEQQDASFDTEAAGKEMQPVDHHGCCYRLELQQAGMSIPELRWWRRHPQPTSGKDRLVSVREAVASLESYEPVRALTIRSLSLHSTPGEVSTTVLRGELTRLQESPIVLNRRLREVVLATIARNELSMSEIALRCGRVKRDRRGNESGETSWLARRLGILPEGGRSTTTPWIHTDVLALIARSGLGVSPREVEL
jgi:hypothetical protein